MRTTNFKRTLAAAAASVFLLMPAAHASGVPTVDVANLVQQLQNFLQLKAQYEQLVSSYKQQVQSFNQQITQYQSMTGVRGFANVNNTQALRDFLDKDLQRVMRMVRTNGLSALPPEAQQLYREFGMGNKCQRVNSYTQANCIAKASLNAMKLFTAMQGAQKAQQRADSITQMLNSISSTTDTKGIAEMQARIAQEQTALANEQARMQLLKQQFDAEEKMNDLEQQAKEDFLLGG